MRDVSLLCALSTRDAKFKFFSEMRTDKATAVRLIQCPQGVVTNNIFGSDGKSNIKYGIERSCE